MDCMVEVTYLAIDINKAIREYNDIMMRIGLDHNTIGTEFSESTDDWNLRDIVSECDYVLGTYYEDGHANAEMRWSNDLDERQLWKSETSILKKFINKYKVYINNMKCKQGHCSSYDN